MVNFSIFNELSLPLHDDCCPQKKFGVFFELLKQLKINGINTVRSSEEFKTYNILPNVTFLQFMGQQTDIDFKRKLRSLIDRSTSIDSPIVKDEDEDQMDIKNKNEYCYKNQPNIGGLACCDIWDTIAISFNTDDQWDTHNIELTQKTLLDNGSISEKQIIIKHASKAGHLNDLSNFFDDLEKENQISITKRNFWSCRKTYFPNTIRFCLEVEQQVKMLDQVIFDQAKSILRDIETKKKLITDFNFTGESESVRNTPKRRKEREFTIEGQKQFFQNHIKNLSKNHRIYFLEKDEFIYIGYIGKHLR